MIFPPILRVCPCCKQPLSLQARVREVLEREPDAPLGRVLALVESDEMALVATFVRMEQLARARGSVTVPPKPRARHTSPAVTCHVPAPGAPGSLRASDPDPRRPR